MSCKARVLLALLLATAAACGSRASAEHEAPPPSDEPERRDLRPLLESMNVLVGRPLSRSALSSWKHRIEAEDATLEDFIDAIAASPALGRQIAPDLIFGAYLNVRNYYALPSALVLKRRTVAAGRVVHYLRRPCSADQAEEVRPWWSLDAPILVCPDSHRPEVWTVAADQHGYRSEMPISCDSQVGSPEKESAPVCGCGPALIRCLRDESQYEALHAAMVEEVRATAAHVVDRDLPLERLFTGSETARTAGAELLYRRRLIGATRQGDVAAALAGLDDWPAEGAWAPRPETTPGQHAGLLTSPQLLTWLPDRRQRQRGIYEMMWCAGRNSFGATTEKVFEINDRSANLGFVHDTWKTLAHTELCTDCHARLDYGFQFWMGYPDGRAATHFVPAARRQGRGPLYGDDIDDPRGRADLDPRAFAELAAAQPEFPACMTSHVVSYVLGPDATAEDTSAVRAAFDERHAFRDAMRAALSRYAAAWQRPRQQPAAAVAGDPVASGDPVPIPTDLRARLEEHCTDCHLGPSYVPGASPWGVAYDLGAAALPRDLLVRAADHVAHRKMPKDPSALSRGDREALVEALLAALWPGEDARAAARRYHLGSQPLPAHHIDNALRLIADSAGASADVSWGAIERAIYADQASVTPGFVATTSLEALLACRRAGRSSRKDLRICLDEALDAAHLIRRPPP